MTSTLTSNKPVFPPVGAEQDRITRTNVSVELPEFTRDKWKLGRRTPRLSFSMLEISIRALLGTPSSSTDQWWSLETYSTTPPWGLETMTSTTLSKALFHSRNRSNSLSLEP